MKLVTTKFKSGGLHEKHVVATWNLGNHLSICFWAQGNQKKTCVEMAKTCVEMAKTCVEMAYIYIYIYIYIYMCVCVCVCVYLNCS